MAKYGKVVRTDDWWKLQGPSMNKGLKFVAVDTDKDGVTWYYFQEVL